MARIDTAKSPRKAGWKRTGDHAEVSPAQIIKDRRDQLGLNQGELALKLDYDNANFISMIEKGWSKFPINKVFDIAAALRLPKYWLLERVMDGTETLTALHHELFKPGGPLHEQYIKDLERARIDVDLIEDYSVAA